MGFFPRHLPGLVLPKVDLFGLKVFEEALHHGIVEWIASS
jgi:hypothetical protein